MIIFLCLGFSGANAGEELRDGHRDPFQGHLQGLQQGRGR